MTTPNGTNPYVGPRAITYGEPIYGRDRETEALTNTLVSQRIVLLYSPSGAGKSSLLEAGVRPHLEERGFHVLPTIRVGHVLDVETTNRYLMSTKLSLSESLPEDERWDQERLADVSLEDFLERVLTASVEPEQDPCLVFDQFEELFTLDPADWDEKRAFLTELGVALRQKSRWALFAMREDYIAQLDPLLSLIPTRLAARYRLDLLKPDEARLAVVRPAEEAGVDFDKKAADLLIKDLRKTRVTRAGQTSTVPGRYVEPVVLQAVCRRLWEQSGSQQRIGLADVTALGDVDDALADFCDDRFATAAAESGAFEQRIRDWIERELITDLGFRSQTVSGPADRGPAVLRALEDGHLLRAESRRGTTWYEIPHDRLVTPIRSSNRRWLDANLDPVQTAARDWYEHDRSVDMLLRGILLDNAERWVAEHPAEVLPVDREFVEAGRDEQRRLARGRWLLFAGVAIMVLLVAIGSYAYVGLRDSQAETDAARAETAALVAKAAQAEAEDAAAQADFEAALSKDAEVLAASAAAEAAEAADQAATSAAAEALMDAQKALEEKEASEADAMMAEERAAQTAAALDGALAAEADEATIQQLEEIASAAATEATIAASQSETTALAASEAIDGADEAREAAADADAAVEATWDGEYVDDPALPDLTVELGSRGDTVGWLQQELRTRSALIAPDCFFGHVTEEAVKDAQTANGLAATGVADNEVWKLLGVNVESPVRLFSCFDEGQPDRDGDRCQRAHPNRGVALVVQSISDDDPDGGLNFRPEPNLENAALYPAPNGTEFTATGTCRVGPSTTNWWEMTDPNGNIGWAGAGSLFIDLDSLDTTGQSRLTD